ncbi:hypothetical protein PLESTB_001782100 [Pleodorina starrii]|uniref:RING-type domain-containing protein n=1 Tax=Pleodorina starrii TaxID=330485 RepID=A0A9W6C0P4_9CHLO|nr:hypothetical protein PLESTM_000802900 [Pleodorina starrii]GLC61608.1 hypothetical protein PLESTB_001782100 [Pleodorina starrii]GLC70213.1 hypothetical protein PLESTF_000939200 [Pleodorina starrii]
MADIASSCAGAFVAVPNASGADHEGFLISRVSGMPEYHWIRIQGVDPRTGSPAHAQLEAAPSLKQLLGGSGALGHVCSRLRSAPSVDHFLADLQEVLERLAYGSSAGSGPASRGSAASSSSKSSSSSSNVMQLLLRDLDELGWGCLEELDQDAARMTLVHVDEHGREHRLRLTLPFDHPASPPTAATDLPTPLAFTWHPPSTAGPPLSTRYGMYGGGGGAAAGNPSCGACSNLADVFDAFQQAVRRCQPLWLCLDELDRRSLVLDPPPSVSASRRHLGPPARRLALGGAASLQLRLDPADPRGPPPPGGVAFLGPPDCVAALREGFFGRLHLWSRDSDPVDNLELLLGQPLPAPTAKTKGRQANNRGFFAANGAASDGATAERGDDDVDSADEADEQEPEHALMAECPICMMHLLPLDDNPDEAGGEDGGEGDDGMGLAAAGPAGSADANGGGGGGLVPDVVCPTPACGLAFHSPCLAEWLRSLPDTRVSFNQLFGRCPFCSNPITVRA